MSAVAFVALLYTALSGVLGWLLLVQTKPMEIMIRKLLESYLYCLPVILLLLPLGLAGVYFHNDWSLGPGLAVTLLAWAICIKALLFLLAPGPIERILAWVGQWSTATWLLLARIEGVAWLLIALACLLRFLQLSEAG